ncbi:hypothetical protein HMPREF0541_00493 [Lacticaseibacillus rhamnosus ATCC 21052]|nr:hypothetical protein HMPREF0541_00493 [Lacticaseibacillus rhamnosus ATCC 21052]
MQRSACKDLCRNGQDRAITAEAAYIPIANRTSSRSVLNAFTSPETACKDLGRNGQRRPSRPRPLTLRFLPGLTHALV